MTFWDSDEAYIEHHLIYCDAQNTKIIAKLSVEETLKLLDTNKDVIEVHGYKVRLNNPRYILFKNNQKCVWCEQEINIVHLVTRQQTPPGGTAIFSFYKDGTLLFNKDHIMPKKRGGPDQQWNFQHMCQKCNSRKGHGVPHSDRFTHPHTPYTENEKRLELFMREKFGY